LLHIAQQECHISPIFAGMVATTNVSINTSRIILAEGTDFSGLPGKFLQAYHTHLVCQKGWMEFLFNGHKMRCSSTEFLFWFAESKVEAISFSKNFKALVLLVEKDYLIQNVPDQGWGIDATLYSKENPVKTLKDKRETQKILYNFRTLYNRFQELEHRFYEEILRLQVKIFILEMWNIFADAYERRKHSVVTGTLYEKFIQLLQEHSMKNREVQFYSKALNVTPKYLNQISKNTSGITASQWIQRYARDRIIILLENKNVNIAEIADEMEFTSRSFFTRYVKKLLGVTPTEYRERMA
jgi:AraC-like DNA-binding protein